MLISWDVAVVSNFSLPVRGGVEQQSRRQELESEADKYVVLFLLQKSKTQSDLAKINTVGPGIYETK